VPLSLIWSAGAVVVEWMDVCVGRWVWRDGYVCVCVMWNGLEGSVCQNIGSSLY